MVSNLGPFSGRFLSDCVAFTDSERVNALPFQLSVRARITYKPRRLADAARLFVLHHLTSSIKTSFKPNLIL